MDKLSYALGLSLGNNLKNSGVSGLDFAKLTKGIRDVYEGITPEMTAQDAQAVINDYFQALQEQAAKGAIEEGNTFLAQNAQRPEVTTLESGLQYEIITKGEGVIPVATDSVTVHYHGTLINGTVFVANLRVFSRNGECVKVLANNLLLSKNTHFIWNGITDKGKLAQTGIYMIYVELFHPEKRTKTQHKTTLVITSR